MKIIRYPVFLLILSFIVNISCKSGATSGTKIPDQSYLYSDLKFDALYPAAQVELQINSNGSKIYGLAYTANGQGPHPTLLLLHGLPGNERGLDIAQSLRRGGYNVIYFDYRGSWGSKGEFTFQNAIDDVSSVIKHITDSTNQTLLKVDPEKIYLAGHSMGAGIAMIAGQDERVKGIIGVSLFNPYTLFQGDEARGTLLSLKEYLVTLGMLNANPNQFLDEILSKVDNYNVEKMISNTQKPILVIDEHMNNTYLAKYNKLPEFEYKIWNTDHAFTSRRIALTRVIKSWLDENTRGNEIVVE